jgi:hypothetical protein
MAVLMALGGLASVADLVRLHGGSVPVARASVSRALRRLWRAGRVDLFARGRSLGDSDRGVHVDRVRLESRSGMGETPRL